MSTCMGCGWCCIFCDTFAGKGLKMVLHRDAAALPATLELGSLMKLNGDGVLSARTQCNDTCGVAACCWFVST